MNTNDKQDSLTLGILEEIEKNKALTQRDLADNLGVALGLANSYLKRCARKGFIKIKHAPANRYLYYLTPQGFSEKSRLTANYLSISFDFYRKASQSISSIYTACNQRGWHSLVLYGRSELTEIAFIRAQEFNIELVGIIDPEKQKDWHLNLPVWSTIEEVAEFDACLLTAVEKPGDAYCGLRQILDQERILVPEILGISNQVAEPE